MRNKYSRLCIDRTKIKDWIFLWCEENLHGNFDIIENEITNRIQYIIDNDGNIIKLDFIKCSSGLLTIQPNVGKNIPISTQIAEKIYERVSNVIKDSPFIHGFSVLLTKEDFFTVIELISENKGVILTTYSEQLEEGKAKYYLHQFKGPAGDTVTIKYYLSTNRIQIQGKPLWLFNEIISMISEAGVEMNEVVDAQLRYYNIDINKEHIYEEMETILGTRLFKFLPTAHKAILSTAFIFSKLEISMDDFSPMVQQALRCFEGFAKKVFNQKGLECIGNTQLGSFFVKSEQDNSFSLKTKYSELVNDDETEKKLAAMYNFYFKKRHPYSHATAYDYDTVIISDRKVADELFSEIIYSMKAWYESLI